MKVKITTQFMQLPVNTLNVVVVDALRHLGFNIDVSEHRTKFLLDGNPVEFQCNSMEELKNLLSILPAPCRCIYNEDGLTLDIETP